MLLRRDKMPNEQFKQNYRDIQHIYNNDMTVFKFVNRLGTNQHIQQTLRSTDLKGQSIVLEQTFDNLYNNSFKDSYISKGDIYSAIQSIKFSPVYDTVKNELEGNEVIDLPIDNKTV